MLFFLRPMLNSEINCTYMHIFIYIYFLPYFFFAFFKLQHPQKKSFSSSIETSWSPVFVHALDEILDNGGGPLEDPHPLIRKNHLHSR